MCWLKRFVCDCRSKSKGTQNALFLLASILKLLPPLESENPFSSLSLLLLLPLLLLSSFSSWIFYVSGGFSQMEPLSLSLSASVIFVSLFLALFFIITLQHQFFAYLSIVKSNPDIWIFCIVTRGAKRDGLWAAAQAGTCPGPSAFPGRPGPA